MLTSTRKPLVGGLVIVGLFGVLLGSCSAGGGGGRASGSVDGQDDRNPLPELCTGDDCAVTEWPDDCDGGASVTILGYQPGPRGLLAPALDGGADEDECVVTLDWSGPAAEEQPETPRPPAEETHQCPAGTLRLHVRDLWSDEASPTLNAMPERPLAVVVVDSQWNEYAARQESAGCDWYSVCFPVDQATQIHLKAVGPTACAPGDSSGGIDISSAASASEVWIDYAGSNLQADYTAYPTVPTGPDAFRVTTQQDEIADVLCPPGKPDQSGRDAFTKLHIRYFWGDPDVTGFAGTACGDEALGFDVPPYPTSLKVERQSCANAHAMLEFNNGHCPWYTMLVPNSEWAGNITVRYPDNDTRLFSPSVPLPEPRTADEYWLVYSGAPDDTAMFGTACMNWSQRANVYHFFTQNPGPGYPGCGSDTEVVLDPCNPPVPDGYQTVHFRYIWAGQKTFTFFPKREFMPAWIVLEVNGGGGNNDVICYRESDRPWYNCQVPSSEFYEGATWRAVDKQHDPEWNTVAPRPFPSEPGEYWLRWYYGKPDIPEFSEFKFYDYYPDGTNGDWSATGAWNDEDCADKPPATPVSVGFGGWFPYNETNYSYPFGTSLARTFPEPAKVQDLLDAFVYERYLLWRDHYVEYERLVCGSDTARVRTDPPETVSEGQGYGIAMSAAIGDKETFDKLWNFVRHYLSQSAKKYCGGLMGWMWDGAIECRERDATCDPDSGSCGGNQDSAFDADVDIAIGLVYAAMQWPEYRETAVGWLLKMECEIDDVAEPPWHFPAPGDTFNKEDCSGYPGSPCSFVPGLDGRVNVGYYPPGYFRVFGDFLARYLDATAEERESHRRFWYKAAESVYELLERCYDSTLAHPALVTDWGHYQSPCDENADNYNWARYMWRVGVDAAWFGHRTDLPEVAPGSSEHFPPRSRMQAKIDNIQAFFAKFHENNPPEPNANRFSTICQNLDPSGTVTDCDPALGHNSYFVNTAMTAFVSAFDNDGQTTPALRREAIEEAVSTTVINDRYYQESIGVYTMLFLSGNFPNPLEVP